MYYFLTMNAVAMDLSRELKGISSFDEACWIVVRRLCQFVPHFHWVGIYLLQEEDLVLAAWDGPQATKHTRISIGQGICGLAARLGETVVVDDVNTDSRYLACFPQTRAEIVVPIFEQGEVIGEIDVDSDKQAALTNADRSLLEEVAALLVERYT